MYIFIIIHSNVDGKKKRARKNYILGRRWSIWFRCQLSFKSEKRHYALERKFIEQSVGIYGKENRFTMKIYFKLPSDTF
jgi:hypothetical protein